MFEYAKKELSLIKKDEYGAQEFINESVLEIVKIFSEQGHSNLTAECAISILERLLRFKPLTPLTGEDDEWQEAYAGVLQNKRYSSVFKYQDGTVIDIQGVVVSSDGGTTWYTNGDFRKKIKFPYTVPTAPEHVYIEYNASGKYEIITNQPERIKALYEKKKKGAI